MAWQLSGNAGQEITNEGLRGELDSDLLQILMRTEGSLASLPGLGPTRSASNNWAIAGKFSASGAPMLANDPHLGFSVPAIWYLARIVTPDLTQGRRHHAWPAAAGDRQQRSRRLGIHHHAR
jgi:acyl-homoserine lactone acylase PvdQ